jgi:hypothetical protein
MDDPGWTRSTPKNKEHLNVPAYELLAVVTWGHLWRGRTLCFHCDNEGICKVVNRASRYSKNPDTDGLLHQVFYTENLHNVFVICVWVPRDLNVAADLASRVDVRPSVLCVLQKVPSISPLIMSNGINSVTKTTRFFPLTINLRFEWQMLGV